MTRLASSSPSSKKSERPKRVRRQLGRQRAISCRREGEAACSAAPSMAVRVEVKKMSVLNGAKPFLVVSPELPSATSVPPPFSLSPR